ncbi:FUSC family protein [Heyndrickxia oleronia]|uniref:FUSC family protein n=1 Tax=Heyndrickxia oleronia TaxID=38875 RepID=UPI001C0F351B|nr:FUSC family protein [Heyndrickxia oleronia]MBU5211690.1 FUSC family protein [Heyndrickxia oleronia]
MKKKKIIKIRTTSKHKGWRGVFHINRTPKYPWKKAISAAITMGLPFLIGALFGHIEWGLLAGIGGFTSLYVHNESYKQRAIKLIIVNIGLVVSFALGIICGFSFLSTSLILGIISFLSTFICSAYKVLPPSGYFFVLVCGIGTGLQMTLTAALLPIGIALMGGCLAWLIGMSEWFFDIKEITQTTRNHTWKAALNDSSILLASIRNGAAIFVATLIAFALGFHRPYWVSISCASVLQGATISIILHRSFQRSIGTAVGVFIAGGILALQPSYWLLGLCVMTLQFLVEMIIVRNYAFAVVFITPLALLIAETGRSDTVIPALIEARLLETLLGCAIGLATAYLIWKRSEKS